MSRYARPEPIEPTADEARAIRALKRVAKNWPKSLWLFSANGTLCVMRAEEDGGHHHTRDGNIDPDYVLDEVRIPNDGGDW